MVGPINRRTNNGRHQDRQRRRPISPEAVFTDPFRFDIERQPNKHLGFGGHRRLGLSLARLELTTPFRAFARRVARIEPAGEPLRIRANLVGGFKALPVRLGLSS